MDKHRKNRREEDGFDDEGWEDEDPTRSRNQKKKDKNLKELRKKFSDD